MQQMFYHAAPYVVLAYRQDLQAYNSGNWQGWVRYPSNGGMVVFSNDNIDSYRYAQLKPATTASSSHVGLDRRRHRGGRRRDRWPSSWSSGGGAGRARSKRRDRRRSAAGAGPLARTGARRRSTACRPALPADVSESSAEVTRVAQGLAAVLRPVRHLGDPLPADPRGGARAHAGDARLRPHRAGGAPAAALRPAPQRPARAARSAGAGCSPTPSSRWLCRGCCWPTPSSDCRARWRACWSPRCR